MERSVTFVAQIYTEMKGYFRLALSQVLVRSQICVTAVVPSGQTVFADDCKAEGVGTGVESSRRKHCWDLEANKLSFICRRSSAPSQHVEYFVHPSLTPNCSQNNALVHGHTFADVA
jgi:hypothetical protein